MKKAEHRRIDAFFFLKLYIIVLVLPNIKMNPPQVYMCELMLLNYGVGEDS